MQLISTADVVRQRRKGDKVLVRKGSSLIAPELQVSMEDLKKAYSLFHDLTRIQKTLQEQEAAYISER